MNEEGRQSQRVKQNDHIPYDDEGSGQEWKSLSVDNHKNKGLRIYKQWDQTQKGTQYHSDQEGEARASMPLLDKPTYQFLRPSLEKEKMSKQVPS